MKASFCKMNDNAMCQCYLCSVQTKEKSFATQVLSMQWGVKLYSCENACASWFAMSLVNETKM